MMIKLIDLIITLVTTVASIVGFVMIVVWPWNRDIDFDFWVFLTIPSLFVGLVWAEISNRFINWD